MNNLAEIIEKQSAVISIQSGIIKDLFILLSQHIAAEELDKLPEVGRLNKAAALAKDFM